MKINRRNFCHSLTFAAASSAIALAAPAKRTSYAKSKFRVGVTDWNLRQEGKIEAVALAKKLGFDGVQISIGVAADRLPLSDATLQQSFLS